MTKVSVALVAALSGLVLAFTAAPLAVAKDGDKSSCAAPARAQARRS